jgi:aromatic-L-amino-acid/L-tryptophan decarboxylase
MEYEKKEESLDPEDWESFRKLGYKMVDEMIDKVSTIREKPVWQPVPQSVRDATNKKLPKIGIGEEKAYQAFKEHVLPNPLGNMHPRFWGWVIGTGFPFAALVEMLAATLNFNMGGREHAANYVERQVIRWCKEMFDYPENGSGILVSGGSMANMVGLTVARNVMAGVDIRSEGVGAAGDLVVYGSVEGHSSLQKAIEVLGIGNANYRKIPTNQHFQIDIQQLKQAIASDRAMGKKPICVIGNAGTVNTGAYDDLNELAALSKQENMWFHVDGAFGALGYLAESKKEIASGMRKADSLAFDLHKWMYMPIEVACVLIRDPLEHASSFTIRPDYLNHMPRGAGSGEHVWFSDLGLQLTRGFKALKVWMSFQAYGLNKFSRLIEQNISQAEYLGELVEKSNKLELMTPVTLNVVCFRYDFGFEDEEINKKWNSELLMLLHEGGIAVPSYTILNGKFCLRAAIVNHRSRLEDFDLLVENVVEIGDELASLMMP